MKKIVLDITFLQDFSSFFKSKLGRYAGKKIMKWLSIDKVNTVHSNNFNLRGAEFTSALLKEPLINVSYDLHNSEYIETLPPEAFITVSNHPIGSLDGIILIDIFASRRPDFRVMVNGLLANIEAMKDNFISVKPDSKKKGPNARNVNGVRASMGHLLEGHPMGFFPSGSISFYNKKRKNVYDNPWTHSIIRLIRKANVPIYPVYFDFKNSNFFYFLGKISWQIRTLRIPAEAFNKQGKRVHVYLGKPIEPSEIKAFADDKQLAEFLYNRTYAAKTEQDCCHS